MNSDFPFLDDDDDDEYEDAGVSILSAQTGEEDIDDIGKDEMEDLEDEMFDLGF